MNLLRIWKTQGGFIVNGVDYQFDDFDSVAFTYSQTKSIMRGANSTNRIGIDTEQNNKNPDVAVATIVDMSQEAYALLNKCYKEDIRIDLYFIDKSNLAKVQFNNAKITAPVRQLNIAEGDENMSVQLSVASFDVDTGEAEAN